MPNHFFMFPQVENNPYQAGEEYAFFLENGDVMKSIGIGIPKFILIHICICMHILICIYVNVFLSSYFD
jgi:hypothetical protein